MNKNFMYGIGAVKYKDFTIGYIEKNSFDLGGKKPEAAKIEAEQRSEEHTSNSSHTLASRMPSSA